MICLEIRLRDVLQRTGALGVWQTWIECLLCSLPNVWSWACYLTSWSLSFLFFKKWIIIFIHLFNIHWVPLLCWAVSKKYKISQVVIVSRWKINRVRTQRVTRCSFGGGGMKVLDMYWSGWGYKSIPPYAQHLVGTREALTPSFHWSDSVNCLPCFPENET